MTETVATGTSTAFAAIVFNPSKLAEADLRSVVARIEKEQGRSESLWFETAEDDSGAAAARAAVAAEPAVIMVAGGDGTVRTVAQEVYESGIPLALLPAGTGNLLARNLELDVTDLAKAVANAFTGVDRKIDIALAGAHDADGATSTHAFLVMAGIGLDASMASGTDPTWKKRVGWLAYIDPIARSVIRNTHVHIRYRIDSGHPRSLRAHTVIVGNCGTLTANILLLPDAVIDDGFLDVVVLRPRSAFGWARIGSRLATNGMLAKTRPGRWLMSKTPDLKALNYTQASRFEARFEGPQEFQLDGDPLGPVTGVRIAVIPHGLTLRVPAA